MLHVYIYDHHVLMQNRETAELSTRINKELNSTYILESCWIKWNLCVY